MRASPDGNTLATGSYSNWVHLVDQDKTNTQYELSYKKQTISKTIKPKNNIAPAKIDYIKKTDALDFHPCRNSVAVASLNCFGVFSC